MFYSLITDKNEYRFHKFKIFLEISKNIIKKDHWQVLQLNYPFDAIYFEAIRNEYDYNTFSEKKIDY